MYLRIGKIQLICRPRISTGKQPNSHSNNNNHNNHNQNKKITKTTITTIIIRMGRCYYIVATAEQTRRPTERDELESPTAPHVLIKDPKATMHT